MAKTKFVILTDTSSGIPVKKFKAGLMRLEGHILKCYESAYNDSTLVGAYLLNPGILATVEEEEEA